MDRHSHAARVVLRLHLAWAPFGASGWIDDEDSKSGVCAVDRDFAAAYPGERPRAVRPFFPGEEDLRKAPTPFPPPEARSLKVAASK